MNTMDNTSGSLMTSVHSLPPVQPVVSSATSPGPDGTFRAQYLAPDLIDQYGMESNICSQRLTTNRVVTSVRQVCGQI